MKTLARATVVAALAISPACAVQRAPSAPAPEANVAPATPASASPPAPAAPALHDASSAVDRAIVFVENDYPRALADARTRGLPLFIDAWATWCHTCLSMRSYVFPDPALKRHASRFVWLSLDTELPENADVVTRLAVKVLPTLFVLDPSSEKPAIAWRGSLTATELATLLDDAELSARRRDAGGEATAALLRALRASATGKNDEAIAEYRAALALAPIDWSRRAQAVDGLVTELAESHQLGPCVTEGAAEAPKMPPGSALADVLRAAMGCAAELPRGALERAHWPALVALGERVASDPSQPILADDRSDLYSYVIDGLRDLGRPGEAQSEARVWAAMLEEQAGRAATPSARAVFDAHRLLAYVAMGEPQKAVPMLELSEHDFPADYNPPARLAGAYRAMKKYDDALGAVARALSRAYGPRKLRLWSLQADLYEDKGDAAAAQRSLHEASDYAKVVPLPGSYPKLRDAIEKRLAKLAPRAP